MSPSNRRLLTVTRDGLPVAVVRAGGVGAACDAAARLMASTVLARFDRIDCGLDPAYGPPLAPGEDARARLRARPPTDRERQQFEAREAARWAAYATLERGPAVTAPTKRTAGADVAVEAPPTIIGLVEQALRAWFVAMSDSDHPDSDSDHPDSDSDHPDSDSDHPDSDSDHPDPRRRIDAAAYSVFYIDPRRPDRIQTSGAPEDRCGLWIEPDEIVPGADGAILLVDVKLAYRRDGQPIETEFQLRFSEALKAVIH